MEFYAGSLKERLLHQQIIADLPFAIRKLRNQPMMYVKVGGVDMIAVFDTGQYGALYTDDATKARLIAAGVLKPSYQNHETYNLTDLVLAGRRVHGIAEMAVNTSTFPAAAALGLGETNILSLGYGFLLNYKTIWDYENQHIYLLTR